MSTRTQVLQAIFIALSLSFATWTLGGAGFAKEAGADLCLDEFFGHSGRAEYSISGKPARVEGELKIIMAMGKNGESGCGVFIEGREHGASETKNYILKFGKDAPQHLPTGTRVVANGKMNGTVLSISSGSDPASFEVSSIPDVAPITGSLSVTVILVNFLDSTLAATPADIDNMINASASSLSKYYGETSFGKLTVTGTIKGPYTINYNGLGSCDYGTWASAADAAAGVSSGYRMYVLAPSGCGWGGLGMMPGTQTWISGSYWNWQDAYCHEFGHNLGMHHATVNGTAGEYSDHSCCMGNPGNPPHCNAPHKDQMGWMGAGTTTTLSLTGPASNTFTLNALELNNPGLQIVKFPKTDTGDTYFVSYRAPIGLDASNLASGYHFGTSVHHYSAGSSFTYMLGAYGDNQTYIDSVNGIAVTQTAHTANTATITINIKKPPIAVATATPSQGSAPLTVNFDASGSSDPDGTIASYAWTFGDNTSGSGVTTSHTYAMGQFSAKLTLTDNEGFTATRFFTITAYDPSPIYTVSGKVTDNGAGVSGATVSDGTRSAITNGSGDFSLTNVPGGIYTLSAAKPGYGFEASPGNPATVINANLSGRNFYRPLFYLSGEITNVPKTGTLPTVHIGDGIHSAVCYTSGNGGNKKVLYSLGVPDGSWNLFADLSGYTISPNTFTNPLAIGGTSQAGRNFNGVASTTYSIAGAVTTAGSGTGVSGVVVSNGSQSSTTDSIGNYKIIGVANGSYTLTPSKAGCVFSPATLAANVSSANLTGKNFTIPEPGKSKGDFNADKKTDILLRHPSSGAVILWLMQ